MATTPRIDFRGARHHCMLRGLRPRPGFGEQTPPFLEVLGQLTERFGVEVHGYALRRNQTHLMLRTPHANLAQAMCWLVGQGTERPEAHHPVTRGRYQNVVVDAAHLWAELLTYLHILPTEGRTSRAAYVDATTAPRWLHTTELQRWFGSTAPHLETVAHPSLHPASHDLVSVVAWTAEPSRVVSTPVRTGQIRLEPKVASDLVFALLGRDWRDVAPPPGQTHHPPADLAAWVMHRIAGLSWTEIARSCGVGTDAIRDRIRAFDRTRHLDPWLWSLCAALDVWVPTLHTTTSPRMRSESGG